MRLRTVAVLVIACAGVTAPAFAHEVRPAYLELRETPAGELAVLWKTPMRGEMRLALAPVLSGASEELAPLATRRSGGAAVQTWRLRLLEPLRGRTLHIDGLRGTLTDALVRIEFADGDHWVGRLTPQQPELVIPARSKSSEVAARSYLGARRRAHPARRRPPALRAGAPADHARHETLALTITAFTVAHSITLALATLGFVRVPPPRSRRSSRCRSSSSRPRSCAARRGEAGLAARAPWIVAFTFGLLHGFGFAGALAEIGLPHGQIPLALLFFNVGVEAGQLLFVAAVLALVWPVRRARLALPGWAGLVPPYAIGSVAMFWVIERIAAF